jgi:hypothetical protein
MIAWIDPVRLLCELIEASGERIDATTVREGSNAEIEILSRIGAVASAKPFSVVTCQACDNDHIARLEFDPATRRHWHFCPEAGLVMIEDAALASLRTEPQWLVDWLATALPLTPPVRTRELIRDIAWYCGDAHIGGNALTVVLGIGLSVRRNLEALAAAIPPVPRTQLGLVLTTTADPPQWLALPHGYKLLDLRQIVRFQDNDLMIDRTTLIGWITGWRKGLHKPAQLHVGRPSDATSVREIFRERRAQALPFVNQAMEAREIRAEIASRNPERDAPAVKTIERHLRQMHKANTGGL